MTQDNLKIEDRPISGDISPGRRSRVVQRSKDEFLAQLDQLLDHPLVEAVRWNQYTPYFNDGEPCEFRVGEFHARLNIKLKHDFDDEEPEEEDDDEPWEASGRWVDTYQLYEYKNPQNPDYSEAGRVFEVGGVNTESLYRMLKELDSAAYSYETVLNANFGDHATVVATKSGFEVEYLEHD